MRNRRDIDDLYNLTAECCRGCVASQAIWLSFISTQRVRPRVRLRAIDVQ